MTVELKAARERVPDPFYDPYVLEYLKLGSVDKVVGKHRNRGISFAELHRQLDSRGIITLLGPSRKRMSRVTFFLSQLLEKSLEWSRRHLKNRLLPLEQVYRDYMPQSFRNQVSTVALHRILAYVTSQGEKNPEIRRYGTAVLISPEGNPDLVLVAEDISPPNDKYGKRYGALTFPMGFSEKGRQRRGILKVLQQEVWSDLAVRGLMGENGALSSQIVPAHSTPLGVIRVANVDVSVHTLSLSAELAYLYDFSSDKLRNFAFLPLASVARILPNNPTFRSGVADMAQLYQEFLEGERSSSFRMSSLNLALVQLKS